FPEMHYAPFYRPQEPARLSPPADAVPITGKETPYTLEEAKLLESPLPQTPENLARGVQVFMVNCAVCHGATGRGNGPMSDRFAAAGATRPADYTSDDIRSTSDGELFFSITNGLGFMPRFGPILPADDRWAAIQYIHATQQ
ncbi:MAG: cytochrome c, partial [Dehalococcoidia bacterium]|nr:cytochrome c [Dehalococcoidia bacterium]